MIALLGLRHPSETRAAMQQCGARSVQELNASFVRRAT